MGKVLAEKNQLLTDNELVQVFSVMRPFHYNIIEATFIAHLRKTTHRPRTIEDYAKLARFMLLLENNLWEETVNLVDSPQDPKTAKGILDLSHSKIRSLRLNSSFGNSILDPVTLTELDLSYSMLRHFNQLTGTKAKRVNITGCSVTSPVAPYWLGRMKENNIETLILDPATFSPDELALLKSYFTIIDRTE